MFKKLFIEDTKKKKINSKSLSTMMKKYKFSHKTVTVWRRTNFGYTNIAIALNKDVWLYYRGSKNSISIEYNSEKYLVDESKPDFKMAEYPHSVGHTEGWKGFKVSPRSSFWSSLMNFINDILENNISGPHYIDNKLQNGYEQSSKYPDMSF